MISAHKIDAAGRFFLSDPLLDAADAYGLTIESLGRGLYRMRGEEKALCAFLPDFTDSPGGVLSRSALKSTLEFLHQPLRRLCEDRLSHSERPKDDKSVHERRVEIHRLLRFAMRGSVALPADNFEGLENETAECHAKTEQAMREEDAWLKHREFGNSLVSQSVLPDTTIDPERGFVFRLDKRTLGLAAYRGVNQNALNDTFWDILNKATDGRYAARTPEIFLNAREMETFCSLCIDEKLGARLDRVEFEEAVQEKLDSLEERVRSLRFSLSFHRLSALQKKDPSDRLSSLLLSTTALAPVMRSGFLQQAWARHHFMDRHESPLGGLGKEFGVFLAVMEHLKDRGSVSPVQMEALAAEFLPLISFSSECLDILGKASLDDKDAAKADLFFKAKQSFQDASLTGITASSHFLREDYKQTLEVLEKSLGQSGSALRGAARAGVDTAVDFTMDVVNFIRESPKTAAAFVGIASTLYVMNGGDAQSAQAANESIMLFDGSGFEEVAIDMSTLPEEARDVQNWHWDMGPFGLYKHYMYDNAVVGPAQTVMDWIRIGIQWAYKTAGIPVDESAAFSQAAEKVVKPLADQLFRVNIFQNFSHAAFWMYMVSKGYNHGLKGAGKVFELLSPITDMTVSGGYGLGEALGMRKKIPLSARIQMLGYGSSDAQNEKYIYKERVSVQRPSLQQGVLIKFAESCKLQGAPLKSGCLLMALGEAAEVRSQILDVPPDLLSGQGAVLDLPGLKKNFTLNAQNIPSILRSLEGFDLAMTQAAAQIGVQEEWKKRFIIERIHDLRDALLHFKNDQDAPRLRQRISTGLEDLAGIEAHLFDHSPLYRGLFPETDTVSMENEEIKLATQANIRFGRMKRFDRVQRLRSQIEAGQDSEGHNLSLTGIAKKRSALLASHIWNAMVESAGTIKKAVKPVCNKAAVIALSGISAAAVALDMAGAGNVYSDMVSSSAGAALSSAATTLTFLLYNFWEDVLGVHVGSGAVLLAAGAGAGYLHRRGIKPALLTSFDFVKEKTGIDPVSVWDRLDERMRAGAGYFKNYCKKLNQGIGNRLYKKSPENDVTDGDSPHAHTVLAEIKPGDCERCPFHDNKREEREPHW